MLNVGTPAKAIYLPIEVCRLASGQRQLKLDSQQTAQMIKVTAQKPDQRSRRIDKALNQDSKLSTDAVVRTFGMQVSNQMSTVRAPLYPKPYAQRSADAQAIVRGFFWRLGGPPAANNVPCRLKPYSLNPKPKKLNPTAAPVFSQHLLGLQVDARILDGPSLTYEKEFGSVKDGSWNLRNGVRFHQCGQIASYAVASFAPENRYGGPGPEGFQVTTH